MSSVIKEDKHKDIWSLFREAQQSILLSSFYRFHILKVNSQIVLYVLYGIVIVVYLDILYLNKQRLAAVEELEKLKNERVELLEKINQLEEESHIVVKKGFYSFPVM